MHFYTIKNSPSTTWHDISEWKEKTLMEFQVIHKIQSQRLKIQIFPDTQCTQWEAWKYPQLQRDDHFPPHPATFLLNRVVNYLIRISNIIREQVFIYIFPFRFYTWWIPSSMLLDTLIAWMNLKMLADAWRWRMLTASEQYDGHLGHCLLRLLFFVRNVTTYERKVGLQLHEMCSHVCIRTEKHYFSICPPPPPLQTAGKRHVYRGGDSKLAKCTLNNGIGINL